jgi:polyvinyl alcohol dehydrogenase (cytochrome)
VEIDLAGDVQATSNLFADANGRPLLGAGDKDGVYYAVDPVTGKRRWATKVAEPGDVMEDFAIGGFIGSTAAWKGRVLGSTAIGEPPYHHAIDARSGSILWRGVQAPSYAGSAVVNGVVFNGALHSLLRAMDAGTGVVLWAAPVLGPVSSSPAIAGDTVYVGSGTSSSDACVKDAGPCQSSTFFSQRSTKDSGGRATFTRSNSCSPRRRSSQSVVGPEVGDLRA